MKNSKKLFMVLLIVVLAVSSVFAQSIKEVTHGDLYGKTVLLHSNDVHGAIEGYAKMAALKEAYEAREANVILIDAGDYSQGTTYVSTSKGYDAITMMNAVGYDIITLGNHEFDYGFDQLVSNLSQSTSLVLCSNLYKGDSPIANSCAVLTLDSGMKVGFFSLLTPETQTKSNPALIQGLDFIGGEEMYTLAQEHINFLMQNDCSSVICIAHLGVDVSSEPNTSYDVWNNVHDLDFIIDGHSHTVMTNWDGNPIQSTGTAFANIGVVVIDDETGMIEDHYLVDTTTIETSNADVAAVAQTIIDRVNAEYDIKFAVSEVVLNGSKEPGNRTEETNNGDLITDAMLWCITKDGNSLEVPTENILAITNGGGIRAKVSAGDVTKKDINTVLPFGNTVAVVYVKGSELLEALEASTFCTPISLGGFPQVAGIEFTIDTTKEYDKNNETYPGSTYYGPKSINRVTINNINGKAFDPEATYAVITNNFVAAGGDTYYAFASASAQFDTGLPLDEVVMDYVVEVLGGVIGSQYAEPQGRIHVITEAEPEELTIEVSNLDANIFTTKYGNLYTTCKASDFFGELGFTWGDLVTVKFLDKELVLPVVPTYSYVDTGKPAIIIEKDSDGKETGYLSMAINMGNFTTTYGIGTKVTNEDKTWYWVANEGVTFPIKVEFEMYEKGGYLAEYILHDLSRTNNREDYPNLTDEEFANFRQIKTTGMGNSLYRTSNPVNPELGRNTYADAAIKNAGVTVIMNLSDDQATAEARECFAGSYYSKQNVIYLNLGVDFADPSFQSGLAEGLRFFANNPGVYAVHCTEGKDRAGFVSALLECLMGATAQEVVEDYMTTYYNYYGVEKGTEKYEAIANKNIVMTLKTAFGVPADYDITSVSSADLQYGAQAYLKAIGLTDAEIAALKANLAK